MLTSLLPLGVWLFGSWLAALTRSVLTLSLYSSVVQKTDDTISATTDSTWIKYTCQALMKPNSCLPVPSWLVKEDWEDRSARSGGSAFPTLSDPETWVLPLLSSGWDDCCCGWSLVCGCESSGCMTSQLESTFPFSSKKHRKNNWVQVLKQVLGC